MMSSPLVKVSFRNGIVGGVLGSVMLCVLYYMNDVHPLLINPFMDIRIFLLPIFIFFTLKEYKSRYSNGILYFWQGMIGSYIFLLMYSAICFLFIVLFAAAVPEFGMDYSQQSIALLKENPDFIKKVGDEEFKHLIEAGPTTGWRLGFVYFFVTLAIGFFMSVILTVILRKTNQT